MGSLMLSASKIRGTIIDLVIQSKEGHIGSSFSIVEMLIAVHEVAAIMAASNTTHFFLSKGHASYAYYALLNEIGELNDSELSSIGQLGSKWYGHLPFIQRDSRFQFGSGSLGHGLPFSLGFLYSLRCKGSSDNVVCLIGDGEANEGTFWETLLLVNKLRPSGLKIMVDCNQSSERAIPVLTALRGLEVSFPYINFITCDGHSITEMVSALKSSGDSVILCETKKGFPVPFMTGNPVWHHRVPTLEEAEKIREFLT